MNRIIWMGIGVAIGVIAFRKVTQAQSALGPAGVNRAVGRLTDGVYDFADAVRVGMRERETELRAALGVDAAVDTGDGTSAGTGVGTAVNRAALAVDARAAGRDAVRR